MKIQLLSKSLLAALLICFAAVSLHAQADPATPDGPPNIENTDQIAKDLNLTPEQKAQLKKIDEEFKAKHKANKAAKKEEAAKIREERIKAHKSVLTPEQAAKYDEILAKKKAKREEKKQKKAEKKAAKKEKKAEKKAIKEELNKQ